jgi:hypothetical protein
MPLLETHGDTNNEGTIKLVTVNAALAAVSDQLPLAK